jgi:hypothetical protein
MVPKQSALLNLADVTVPDLPLGKEVDVEAVLVLNASKDTTGAHGHRGNATGRQGRAHARAVARP